MLLYHRVSIDKMGGLLWFVEVRLIGILKGWMVMLVDDVSMLVDDVSLMVLSCSMFNPSWDDEDMIIP